MSGDREPRNNLVAPTGAAEVLDRRNQRHVQLAGRQLLGKPAGNVHREPDIGCIAHKAHNTMALR